MALSIPTSIAPYLLELAGRLPFPPRFIHHTLRITHLSPFANLPAKQATLDGGSHHRLHVSGRQSLGLIPHDC